MVEKLFSLRPSSIRCHKLFHYPFFLEHSIHNLPPNFISLLVFNENNYAISRKLDVFPYGTLNLSVPTLALPMHEYKQIGQALAMFAICLHDAISASLYFYSIAVYARKKTSSRSSIHSTARPEFPIITFLCFASIAPSAKRPHGKKIAQRRRPTRIIISINRH